MSESIKFLGERLTFDRLFRLSEPKRVRRSDTVRGPPLEIDAHSDSIYHTFNFKSFPSTTGLRHHGYIRFFAPRGGDANSIPLQHVPCEVDCTCPDFRYRWAWVLKQRGSSRVGPNSMNQAINRAPWITNPRHRASLCKHILAARDYIYGLLGNFSGTPDTGEKLAKLVKYADRRWTDWQGQSANAKEREAWFKAAKAARNVGLPPPAGPPEMYRPAAPKAPVAAVPPAAVPKRPQAPKAPMLPMAGKPALVQAGPLAVPPGERGREMPARPLAGMKGVTPPGKRGRGLPPLGSRRRESLEAWVSRVNGSRLSEDQKLMTQSMTNLQEAIKIVEEMEQDELSAPVGGDVAVDAPPSLPPSEPPVSDDAIGADTEGNVALQLLTDIKDLLTQLVAVEAGEEEAEEAEFGEEERPVDALPEPEEEEEEEEDGDDGMAGKAPTPEE